MKSTSRKPTKLAQEPLHYGVQREEQLPTVFEGSTGEIVRQMRAGLPSKAVSAVAANLGVSQERLIELLGLQKKSVAAKTKSYRGQSKIACIGRRKCSGGRLRFLRIKTPREPG